MILRLAAEENKQLEVSDRALEQAERILRDNWPKVRKFADSLHSQNELNSDQVAALLATAGEEQ
jgi:hypothetical protein